MDPVVSLHTLQIADCADLDPEDAGAVVEFAANEAIDFVIIGPEAPLAAGVSDALRAAGILCFGPSRAAAELEASKAFTKGICDAAHAPTAASLRVQFISRQTVEVPQLTSLVHARHCWLLGKAIIGS